MQQEEEEEVCQKNTCEGQLGKALVVSEKMYFMAYFMADIWKNKHLL